MKLFELNTHHTYLNIYPIVSIVSPCEIYIISEEERKFCGLYYNVGETHKLDNYLLTPGKITIHAESLDTKEKEIQEETVVIEDALKYGGGKAKKGFVFDNSPWVFITSGDRLYIWNRETRISKIEYSLSPDIIFPCEHIVIESSKHFVFKTFSDYSIYDVESGQIVYSYTSHIYANEQVVVYGVDGDIHVFDYVHKKELACIHDQFSIVNRIFYVEEGQLKAMNLDCRGYKNNVPEVENLDGKSYRLVDDYLLVLNSDGYYKNYNLYNLGNGEKGILRYRFYSSCYVSFFKGKEFPGHDKAIEQLDIAKSSISKLERELKCVQFMASIQLLNIEDCNFIYKDGHKLLGLDIAEITRSIPRNIKSRQLHAVLDTEKNDNISNKLEEKEEKSIIQSEELTPNPQYGKLICSSKSNKWAVYQKEDSLTLFNSKEDKIESILEDVYLPCLYQNAYFSSDGKSVIMIKGKSSTICNFEDLSKTTFPIEGFVIDRQEGFNGYRPELDITISNLAQPRWRDPISLNYVRPEDMSGHIFRSPHGDYEAKTNFKLVRINRLTGKEITSEEFIELSSRYYLKENSTAEERKVIEERRKKLLEQYGEEKILSKCKVYLQRIFNDLPTEKMNICIKEGLKRELDDFLHKKPTITPLITDALGYVIFCNTKTRKETSILIGNDVWFLNYVSFSQDSRYLAFGAKMAQSDYRSSQSGVYVLFDIEKGKEILRYNEDRYAVDKQQLYAVWSAVFSSKMDSAFYDSNPNSYIVHYNDGQFSTELLKDRSLLCFSPSGYYIAFSNQQYIDYQHHPDHWGHQPSGNIFIHRVDDAQHTLLEFNDFSEGVKGICLRAGNVASAAFSQDERRLLAVGSDGTVVVRNLHFPEEN